MQEYYGLRNTTTDCVSVILACSGYPSNRYLKEVSPMPVTRKYRICSEWWAMERTSVQVFPLSWMLGNRQVGTLHCLITSLNWIWLNWCFHYLPSPRIHQTLLLK